MLYEDKIPEESGYYWCQWEHTKEWEMCYLRLSPEDKGHIFDHRLETRLLGTWTIAVFADELNSWVIHDGDGHHVLARVLQWIGPILPPDSDRNEVTVLPSRALYDELGDDDCIVVEAMIGKHWRAISVQVQKANEARFDRIESKW